MKIIFVLSALFISVWSPAYSAPIAIINARAVTMIGDEIIENATIIIRDDRIVAVGSGIAVPVGARVINADGKFVLPGFMNGATQLGLTEINSVSGTVDHTVTSGGLGLAFDIQYGLNPNSSLIGLARSDGLARAMVVPGGAAAAPFEGQGATITLRDRGEILDHPHTALFARVGGSSSESAGGSRSAQWQILRKKLQTAKKDIEQGAEDAVPRADLLDLVLNGYKPLAIHASRESDIRHVLNLVDDFGIRVVIIGGAEAWRAAKEIADREIGIVLDAYAGQPNSFDEFGARSDSAAILIGAGVKVAFMATSIHYSHDAGSGIRDAAGFSAAFGLPWSEAVRSLTIYPAEMWGISNVYGTLSEGKSADIAIWSGDPLEPLSMPVFMLIEGEEVSLTSRQDLLTRRYAPMNDAFRPAYRGLDD